MGGDPANSIDPSGMETVNKTGSPTFALHNKNAQFLAFDDYNHGIITRTNGSTVVVTSLMIGGQFTIPVDKDKVTIKTNIYRWVKIPSLSVAARGNNISFAVVGVLRQQRFLLKCGYNYWDLE